MITDTNNLTNIIKQKCNFHIPFFQRRYSWDEENCEKLVIGIINAYKDKVSYFIGNIFLKKIDDENFEIFDGQQRIISTLLFNLALCYEMKVEYEECLKDFLLLNLNNKFNIDNGDAEDFELFLNSFGNLYKNNEETLKSRSDNKFCKNFNTFHSLIKDIKESGEIPLEHLAEMVRKHIQCINVQISSNEIRSAHGGNNGIDAYKLFDCLNSTGLPLTDKDIINSNIFRLKDESLGEQWINFCETFKNENNAVENKKINDFIKIFITTLGYQEEVLVALDKEQSKILGASSIILSDAEKVQAYKKILKNMDLLFKFTQLCTFKYIDLDEDLIAQYFKEADRKYLADSKDTNKYKWFKLYVDGIFLAKHYLSHEACKLYLRYLYDDINLNTFFNCLHNLWCTATRTYIISYYETFQGKKSKFETVMKRNIALRRKPQEEDENSFVTSFRTLCEGYYNHYKNKLVGISDDSALVDYLVYKSNRPKTTNITEYVKNTQFSKEYKDKNPEFYFEYFLYLILMCNSRFGSCKFNYDCIAIKANNYEPDDRKDVVKKQDIGNIGFSEAQEDNNVYANKSLSYEEIQARSVSLLTQLFEILDFDTLHYNN